MRWYKSFYRCYIDAHDNPDFQFAYKAFRPPSLPPITGPGPSDRFRAPIGVKHPIGMMQEGRGADYKNIAAPSSF